MKTRIITGLILLLIFGPTLFLAGREFKLFCGIGVGILLYEMIRVLSLHKQMSLVSVFIITILTYVVYFLTVANYNVQVRFINMSFVQLGIMIVLLGLTVFDREFDANDAMKGFLTIYYIGFGVASIAITYDIERLLFIYVMVVSFSSDIFAYFTGYFFGKHKLIEHISPKKTIEGAIGGTIMAVVIGTLFAYYLDLNTILYHFVNPVAIGGVKPTVSVFFLALGSLSISILSQVGDLVASRIKRQFGAKDFGSIFPGHGGLLDRFDSVIFSCLGFVAFLGLLVQIG